MARVSLSRRDIHVLEKIKDPESDPAATICIDPMLPRDPHITDTAAYERVTQRERDIVASMQQIEMQFAGGWPPIGDQPPERYELCVSKLEDIIQQYPDYGSARNNKVQALRRLHGDGMLVKDAPRSRTSLLPRESPDRLTIAQSVLDDLDEAIQLLSPKTPFHPVSPQAAKTLSLAHTQRGAIYHATARLLVGFTLDAPPGRKEADWSRPDFEEAAARDFALGARYGNEVAKGLAVSVNPTAKLCGQMVREAMKQEYGPAYG